MRRRPRSWACGFLLLVTACHGKRTVGGVVIQMSLDRTLTVSDLTELRVEIDPPADGGSAYLEVLRHSRPARGLVPDVAGHPSRTEIPAPRWRSRLGVWNHATPVDVPEYPAGRRSDHRGHRARRDLHRRAAPRSAPAYVLHDPAGGAGCASDVVRDARHRCRRRGDPRLDAGSEDASLDAGVPRATLPDHRRR